MITAHGGAMGTGRNSKKYFQAIEDGTICSDAIEVDIRGNAANLFLSHLPAFFKGKKLDLAYALSFARDKNRIINCDIKSSALFVPVRDLAVSLGAESVLLYTGATKPDHVKDLTVGQIYANGSFFRSAGLSFRTSDLPAIKKYLDSFENPGLKGINVNYKSVDDGFFAECKRLGIGVSVYTVDDKNVLKKYLGMGFDNITTNHPDWVAELGGQK